MTGAPTRVTASDGGIAAGRDVNIGIPPEQLPAMIAAATAPLERQTAQQHAEIHALGERLGASEGILRAVLVTLGGHAGSIEPAALPARIAELVRERQDLLARQRDRPDDPDAALAELDRQLADRLAAGDDPAATALLAQKRDLKLAAAERRRTLSERLQATALRDQREAAEAEATLGELALAGLRYRDAAAHFRAAAALVPADEPDAGFGPGYLERAANALYAQGAEFGDNPALIEAIAGYRALLEVWTRPAAPREWARTQVNLGNASGVLGSRESGTARLEAAVAAYRAAQEEWTATTAPLDWALVQGNLGNVLYALGERDQGTARLEAAVTALQAALGQQTRSEVPLDWAHAQNALGVTLKVLGDRQDRSAPIEQAVAAYRAALQERTRDRAPLQWAETQNNLGNALATLGEREQDTVLLHQAVEAHQAALEIRTRARLPLDWAASQNNLGDALLTLARHETGTERLEAAVAAFLAALEEFGPDRVPLDRAKTRASLAEAMGEIALRTGRPHQPALAEIDAALAVFRAADATAYVAEAAAVRRRIAGDPAP